jgi:hypothetical protein
MEALLFDKSAKNGVKMKKLTLMIILIFILDGCSRLHKEKISNFVSSTSIYSTKNLIFYKIYGSNKSYSRFKIKENESFLCVHRVGGALSDQCLDFGIKGERLPSGTEITITGNVVKTEVQGLSLGGYSSFTYFEGFLKNNEKIWISNMELFEILKKKKKIDIENKKAYEVLKDVAKL